MKLLYRLFAALLAAVLVWSSLPAQTAHAATITVNTTTDELNTDGDCSLREAISAANTNAAVDACPAGSPGADTITLPAGTYQLTLVGSNNDNTAGDLDITEALTINGAGAGSTTIQQTVSGERVIHVVLNVTVNISGVTVRGGSENAAGGGGIYSSGPLTLTNSVVTNNTTTFSGGGIYASNSVTLTNTTVSNNSTTGTGHGGGLRLGNGAATLSGAIFSNNTAAGDGGGIYAGSNSLSATNSTFSNNTGASGGAIATLNDVTITSSTFSNNNASGTNFGGGAIYAGGGTITVNQSLFEANRARGNGGGAISTNIDFSFPTLIVDRSTFRNNFTYDDSGNGGAISANGDLTVTNSTFNGNYTSGNDGVGAQNGGAVAAINSILEMTNVTFSDNRANQHGGALYYRNDNDALLNNVTIASNQADANNNSAGDGGGIFVDDMGTGSILTVRNAIIALNSDPSGGAPDCSGDLQANYSLIGNSAGCILLAGSGNNLIGSNPNLGPLANNGGPTQTRALLAGSPAIDAADPASGGPGACFSTDQRGVARFDGNYDSIVRCDMGAYEFDQTVTPPSSSSSAPTLPSTGFPMGRVTNLPPQPAEKAYAASSDLTLEIPSLGVKAPIVGVLKSEGGWDVSWLGNSVGWLEGSAFPTWQGNTVLTGHVWDADNTPGIFNQIKKLQYGDRFTIRAFGQTYVYEVRENTWVWGGSGISKVFKHEEYDWVTLLTCEGYNPLTGKYFFRRMVRAVLVEVK